MAQGNRHSTTMERVVDLPGPTFKYRPLGGSDTIRVLDLVPSSSTSTTAIECKIRHVSLSRSPRPRYETVSYYWGDPTRSQLISVDGLPLAVPASTEEVLKRMVLSENLRAIWIDSVCINQDDHKERAQQAGIMGKIYSKSYQNIVFLSERAPMGTRDVEAVISLFDEVARDSRDFNIAKGRAPFPIRTPMDDDAIVAFFSRPWFR